jgi:outer membrane protein OmpA-like peptidoglycan-associated protein
MRLTLFFVLFLFTAHAQSDTSIRVYFDFASWQPKNDPFRNLDTNRWERTIRLEGRTDTTGNSSYNRDLADFRLKAVKDLLHKQPYFSAGQAAVMGEEYAILRNYQPQKERCVIITLDSKVWETSHRVSPRTRPVTAEKPELSAETTERMPHAFHPDSAMAVNDVLILRNIEFLINEVVVTLESYPELEQLVKVMKDHPTMHIHIRGHVCCAPAQSLSDQRALKIYNYLISKGIEPQRMTHRGYSNKLPNPEAKDDLFNEIHRRVEIRIVKE